MTNLQWNRAPLWRWCHWWLFCGWHTCWPGEDGRAAAHGHCLWTPRSRAAGRHRSQGREGTWRACPRSRTPGWDPGRLSGHWSVLAFWALRRNCMRSIPFHKQGRIWTQGCSCLGRRASGGHQEESVKQTRGQRLRRESYSENNMSVFGFELGHRPGWRGMAQFARSCRHSSPRCWRSGCWGRRAWRWDRGRSTAQTRSPCEWILCRWPRLRRMYLGCCWTPVAPESGGGLCSFHFKSEFMCINQAGGWDLKVVPVGARSCWRFGYWSPSVGRCRPHIRQEASGWRGCWRLRGEGFFWKQATDVHVWQHCLRNLREVYTSSAVYGLRCLDAFHKHFLCLVKLLFFFLFFLEKVLRFEVSYKNLGCIRVCILLYPG